jgi:hypothetical protein
MFLIGNKASLNVIILLSLSLERGILSLKMLKKIYGLTGLEVETSIVLEVALDFINWKINEHVRNLGSQSLTNDFLNMGVDELNDHLLEVGVFWETC